MKYSEAVSLGRTLLRFTPHTFLSLDCGCLRGMAFVAVSQSGPSLAPWEFDQNQEVAIWPWLNDSFPVPELDWFDTRYALTPGVRYPIRTLLNAFAFGIDAGKMTFEQVLDWIRSVEPQEDEPQDRPRDRVQIQESVCEPDEYLSVGGELEN